MEQKTRVTCTCPVMMCLVMWTARVRTNHGLKELVRTSNKGQRQGDGGPPPRLGKRVLIFPLNSLDRVSLLKPNWTGTPHQWGFLGPLLNHLCEPAPQECWSLAPTQHFIFFSALEHILQQRHAQSSPYTNGVRGTAPPDHRDEHAAVSAAALRSSTYVAHSLAYVHIPASFFQPRAHIVPNRHSLVWWK